MIGHWKQEIMSLSWKERLCTAFMMVSWCQKPFWGKVPTHALEKAKVVVLGKVRTLVSLAI